ncbi:hypothetical protein PsYK624_159160 [Phanerochaete sordida]|uniref:Uncharacterized protein n=1 Tax=Phanerochaete sordida TaxID=48140 RepID=A0A9P3GTX2_9APHY|nr:hypothetical protein PsYK624_159160 [Phanerochaete sordida]
MSDNSTQNSGAKFVAKSDSHYYKDFGGFNNFMASYGLKTYSHSDVQEGKAIIEAFREQDRFEWEEAQKARSG